MASIPLPALGVRPPEQQQGPLEQYGRVLALKSLMGQQQLNQQELQMRQMDLQDRQTFMQAFKDANGDSEKALDLATQRGFSNPQTAIAMRKSLQEYQMGLLNKTEKEREMAIQQADLQLQAHDRISQLPEAQRPQAYQNELQALRNAGVDVSNLPPQYPGDEQFDLMGLAAKGGKADLERAQLKAQTAEAQAKTSQAQATTTKTQMETQALAATGGFSKEQLDAAISIARAKAVRGEQLSDFEKGLVAADQLSKTHTSSTSDTLGVTSTTTTRPAPIPGIGLPARANTGGGGQGVAAPSGAPSSPGGTKESIVDLIGQYRADPGLMSRMFFKHPELLGLIHEKYPDWDQTTYNAKNKVMVGFTSGPQSKEINAINTVSGHLGELSDAVDAMNNGNVQVLNRIANKLGAQVGQTPQTTFQTIVHRVGPEITAAYIPGAGGEAERFANAKDFDPALSPQQLRANIGETVKLLRSKIGALENQYKNTVGRDDFEQRFITPAAKASFDRLAPQGGGGQQKKAPPAGATHIGVGSVDKKKHWLDANGKDLGVAE